MKRLVPALVLAIVLWGVLELLAFLGLSAVERSWVHAGVLRGPAPADRRRRIGRGGRRARGAGAARPGTAELLDLAAGGAQREVLHPFLGYVFDPALNAAENRVAEGRLLISDLGFFVPPEGAQASVPETATAPESATGQAGAAEPLDVAIFGGSVAFILCFEGDDVLRDALPEIPAFAGRPVRFSRFALGGYKQPQQLATYVWLLSLGRSFDVVINLDGFNEVVLPWVENIPQGTFPSYPRNWAGRVGSLPDPRRQEGLGELAFLRGRRRGRARLFAQPAVRYSYLWNLLWRLQDGLLEGRIADVEEALLRHPPAAAKRGYAATGPQWQAGSTAEAFAELAAVWARSSLQMHRLASANGSLYYHFLQPNQYVPGSKRLTAEERRKAFDADHPYRAAVEAGYPALEAAGVELAREGVRFTDLTGLFQDVEETVYFDTCCHVNRHGTALLARAIGDAIAHDLAAVVHYPGVTNPGASNPDVTNPGVPNPGLADPGVPNPRPASPQPGNEPPPP